ncbi:hypothetical protein [Campylobacter peloridis]|uniref:hypothetical protein n=1 Tax=Campylobacter peloridis TaxID=488546 RepID=UPI001C73642B|nr:hypothetical protein [Campylobacter peloridis]MBX1886783.1 hypothetical protein [Campylobacter peloridis]
MKKIWLFAIILAMAGCGVNSKQMVIENTQQLQTRSYQTKSYELPKKLVAKAGVSALQDLGFVIDNADLQTGTITATKLSKGATMRMTLVIREKNKISTLRANAQFGSNVQIPQLVEDPEVYHSFFQVLDKAIFFEKENI